MINLINETLIHPHINTKWHVIGFDKGMLECVSEDSVKVEYITKEFGLEMYAEQQKQRADECHKVIDNLGRCAKLQEEKIYQLEKRWSELKERMEHDEKEAFGEGDVIAHTVHNYVLELMDYLEEDGE